MGKSKKIFNSTQKYEKLPIKLSFIIFMYYFEKIGLEHSVEKETSFQHFLGAVFFLGSNFKGSWKALCTFSIYFLCYCCW